MELGLFLLNCVMEEHTTHLPPPAPKYHLGYNLEGVECAIEVITEP